MAYGEPIPHDPNEVGKYELNERTGGCAARRTLQAPRRVKPNPAQAGVKQAGKARSSHGADAPVDAGQCLECAREHGEPDAAQPVADDIRARRNRRSGEDGGRRTSRRPVAPCGTPRGASLIERQGL